MRGVVAVRHAEVDDVASLAKLTDDGSSGHSRGRGDSPADREQRFEQLLVDTRRVMLVATETGGEIVGLVVATTEEIGALNPVPALTVSTLIVSPGSRRRGVGRALLAGAVEEADERGIDSLIASVSGTDRDANRYLARLGFAPLVVRRIATTSMLRRTLGMSDVVGRVARRRGRNRPGMTIRALSRH
ncbi:MAG: GNAT family N-acetyltransferase [Jatrophihabitans sp.]